MYFLAEPDHDQRIRALIHGVSLLLLPTAPLASLITTADPRLALIGAVALGLLTIYCLRSRHSFLSEYILATALVGQAILLVAVFAGHPWQLDMHMVFFVLLAIVALLGRTGPLIWAGSMMVLHHVGLTLMFPAVVFGGEDLAINLLRSGLHAGVILLETTVLVCALQTHSQTLEQVDLEARRADDRAKRAAEAEADATATRGRTALILQGFQRTFDQVSRRRRGSRQDTAAPSARDDALSREFDEMIASLRDTLEDTRGVIGSFSAEGLGLPQALSELARLTDLQDNVVSEMTVAAREIAQDLAICMAEAEKYAPRERRKVPRCNMQENARQIRDIAEVIQDIALLADLLALITEAEATEAQNATVTEAAAAARTLSRQTADSALDIQHVIEAASRFAISAPEMKDKLDRALDAIGQQTRDVRSLTVPLRDALEQRMMREQQRAAQMPDVFLEGEALDDWLRSA
ncbi:hypothetical protein [Sagittula sp. SSi028]|uniref:hypothetical protein n=1 Tax=Sagittula sp. SSi028 TaxID=3400636 RepID=UPI003AF93638